MTDKDEKETKDASYLGIGISLGLIFGIAIKNIGFGLAIGVAIGAGVDSQKSYKKN